MSKYKQDHIVEANKKVSSVEWLVKELNQKIDFIPMNKWDEITEVIEQAKAMHKEEIEDSFGVGCHLESKRLIGYHDIAEQYYNETYGGNK